MTTTSTEWDKLWAQVSSNRDDFASWEALIKLAEQGSTGGIKKSSSESDIENLRLVYDHFLSKFPLCFGYWKKYADWELVLGGPPAAEQIYERAVVSIHNSVDLWVHFAQFKIEHLADDEDAIRSVFERGAAAVGYDFLSHSFWDKYIEYEESKEQYGRELAILERVITIPMHQYDKYFHKYTALSASRMTNELISPTQLHEIDSQIRKESPSISESEVQKQIRVKIHSIKSDIYVKTQKEVHKRWSFEQEIKRPYFHVKPLDLKQLENWRKYLEFEESESYESEDENAVVKVYMLYERCLVCCAMYEEFWIKYTNFLVSKNDMDRARNAYTRAVNVHVPHSKPAIRLNYAKFEELHGTVDVARQIYQNLLNSLPGHAESIVRFAQFEQRNDTSGDAEKYAEVINSYKQHAKDEKSVAFLEASVARFQYMVLGHASKARETFKSALSKVLSSKYLFLSYLNFEISQCNSPSASLQSAQDIYKKSQNSLLTASEKHDLTVRYCDFINERGKDFKEIMEVENKITEYLRSKAIDKASEETRKRKADEETEEKANRKVGRQSTPEVMLQLALGTKENGQQQTGQAQLTQPMMHGLSQQVAQPTMLPVGGGYYPQTAAPAAVNAWSTATSGTAYGGAYGQYASYYGQSWDYTQQQTGYQ